MQGQPNSWTIQLFSCLAALALLASEMHLPAYSFNVGLLKLALKIPESSLRSAELVRKQKVTRWCERDREKILLRSIQALLSTFKKLISRSFRVCWNKFATLDFDLFQHTRKLQVIYFHHNMLKHVGHDKYACWIDWHGVVVTNEVKWGHTTTNSRTKSPVSNSMSTIGHHSLTTNYHVIHDIHNNLDNIWTKWMPRNLHKWKRTPRPSVICEWWLNAEV